MKILAIEKDIDGVNWSNEKDTLESEARHVYQLYLTGSLREIFFNEHHNAIIIMECESIEKAREILNSLPLVKKGMIKFDVMQLNPYTGYDRIIKQIDIK